MSPTPSPRLRVFRPPLWAALLLTLLPTLLPAPGAGARAAPPAAATAAAASVSLVPEQAAAGEPFTLRGRDLPPDAPFTLTLSGPGGARRTLQLRSDAQGNLEFEARLQQPGAWTLQLQGPSDAPEAGDTGAVDARLDLRVTPAAAPPGDAPPAPPDTPPESAGEPTPEAAPEGAEETPAGAPGAAPRSGAESGPTPEPESEPEPEPAPEPARPAPAGGVQPRLQGDALVAGDAWRLDFPPDSGPSGPLRVEDGRVYLAHGLWLLEIDRDSGRVLERWPLPARAVAIEGAAGGLDVEVRYGPDGPAEVLQLRGGAWQQPVRFGAAPEAFGWLRREAEVADPAARLQRDPTNPWLHFAVGRDADDPLRARAHFSEALARAQGFPTLAQLGGALYDAGEEDLARQALDAALRDFAERGYHPALLTDPELRAAYGFPLPRLQAALARDDAAAAGFWAPWVYRSAATGVPEAREALLDYARMLRAAGDRDGAALWRARADEFRTFQVATLLDDVAARLGRVGWLGVIALLAATLLLQLTLVAKYWRPQTLRHERRRERKPGLGARLLAIRLFSFTEKLVLVMLLAATLVLAALAAWSDRAVRLPAVTGSGTLASVPARGFLDGALLANPETAFVRGYAAQVAGDPGAAQRAYESAARIPGAANNLGALTGDERLYQRALDLSPRLTAARYNLGRITSPSPFHERYQPGQPLLAVPSRLDLQTGLAGSWQAAVAATFTNPFAALGDASPGLPSWLWLLLVALFFALALWQLLWLLLPRPRLARNAPRTWLYGLLALLIPGSGLADELWGVLLLAPWAIVGLDALLQLGGAPGRLGLPLDAEGVVLAVLYALNLIAYVVEFVSYSRRMRELKHKDPELARRYRMRGV